jgi:hypothetical protein
MVPSASFMIAAAIKKNEGLMATVKLASKLTKKKKMLAS